MLCLLFKKFFYFTVEILPYSLQCIVYMYNVLVRLCVLNIPACVDM